MIIHDCLQRTYEWHGLRLGKLTGSRAADMLATIKTGEAAARRDLRTQLVVERLTGTSQEDGYQNDAMKRGIEMEPAALAAYEALTGEMALSVGFVSHDTLPAGCSPDGYLSDWRTLVSLKCPKSATHLRYLKGGVFPKEYEPQMLHELWITGAQFYDFISYDDRFPVDLHVFHVRVQRNDDAVSEYATKARAFLKECDQELAAIEALRKGVAA